MSLNITLSSSGSIQDGDYSAGLSLENDGYYWFLCPFFEPVWRQTGQMIDLYGDAIFGGDQLTLLRAALDEALADVNRRPPEWDVEIGCRSGTPIFDTISRSHAQQLLSDLIQLTERAMRTGMNIGCWGD